MMNCIKQRINVIIGFVRGWHEKKHISELKKPLQFDEFILYIVIDGYTLRRIRYYKRRDYRSFKYNTVTYIFYDKDINKANYPY